MAPCRLPRLSSWPVPRQPQYSAGDSGVLSTGRQVLGQDRNSAARYGLGLPSIRQTCVKGLLAGFEGSYRGLTAQANQSEVCSMMAALAASKLNCSSGMAARSWAAVVAIWVMDAGSGLRCV